MKKLLLLLTMLIPLSAWGEPRNPNPTTPDDIRQNDLDLNDMINNRIQDISGNVCIDYPTFCVDKANNRVGIGTNAPSALLGIRNSSDALIFKITDDGYITKPLQPAFLVTAPANTANTTGDGSTTSIEFDTEIKDQNGDFNPTAGNYKFTAPVDGMYPLHVSARVIGLSVSFTDGYIYLVTSNRGYYHQIVDNTTNSTDQKFFHISVIADMDANDTAYVQLFITGGDKTAEVTNDGEMAYFSGGLSY